MGSHTPPPALDIHPPQKARARQQTHSPRGRLCFVSQAPGPRGHLGSSPQGGQGGGSLEAAFEALGSGSSSLATSLDVSTSGLECPGVLTASCVPLCVRRAL